MKLSKKFVSVLLAGSMLVGMMGVPAYAATDFSFTYPSEAMDVNSTADSSTRYLTTLTQRAASEIPLIFGINVIGGNMFGGLKDLGGTNVNVNPDPYIWNYNYCYPSSVQMGGSGEAAHELPDGQYYKNLSSVGTNAGNGLFWSGGANECYATPVDEIGGVGYTVGLRTDVSIGFNSNLIDQIDKVRSLKEGDEFYREGDENYSPVIVDVQTGSVTSRMYSWSDMGKAISEYLDEHPELATRYDDPEKIGQDIEYFSAGIPYYIASLIASGKIEKKTAAYVDAIDQYTFTCIDPGTKKNVRADVYGEVGNFDFLIGNYTVETLVENGVDVIILGANGYGYGGNGISSGSAPSSSKTDVLRALAGIGVSEEDMPLVMDSNATAVTPGTNGYNFAPTTCLFVPYVQSYAYMEELEAVDPAINPVAMVRYMMEKFLHIKSGSAEAVALNYIGNKWDSVDEDYDRVPKLSGYTYDVAAIEKAMEAGAAYAASGKAEKNGNLLLPAIREDEPAYLMIMNKATTTKPSDSDEYITFEDAEGVTKYLNITELANSDEDLSGSRGFTYKAVFDYYNTSEYGYGNDLAQTLENYAKRMVKHVWIPPTEGDDPIVDPDPIEFSDVAATSWYADAVQYVASKGIFNGISATEFAPQTNMTRAMFVTVLGRIAGVDESKYTGSAFTDVPEGKWYSAYVKWASENNIVNGMGGNLFDPEGNITREQMATILYRYAQFAGIGTDGSDAKFNGFKDKDTVSSYAKDAMIWATANGIINGTDIGLEPKAKATRAQVAQMIMNAGDKLGIK